ncbi:RagB/SusD family nutrient uptake outer membrane protein [Sphingobacterium paucimobilis]|uniref:RagB/SusD family nutrient uptake outer membrane protein n=1 Tax=Sphingobacterium paucimobilis HER1398 TaxID=1346330 RepID=U2J845_9SPHI|nr:RagB/SusD family nutrient uptake outer membrane protein [Sphingobacterium paucimobilis]ERJ58838.1 hypothetical protein M472_08655 [Sphingobacterium paucimobilis HER1398]
MTRTNIFKYLTIGVIALGLTSCDKFLEKSDKDLLIPETVEQYRQILRGDAYSSDYQKIFNWIHFMDDDIEVYFGDLTKDATSSVNNNKAVFLWDKELENEINLKDGSYGACYKHILACNVILNTVEMTGAESDRNLLMAQAHVLRAYYYFTLVNLYAKPYNQATAATDPGVSIWLESKPSLERLSRATVAETYALINSDMAKALDLFKRADKPNNNFEITEEAALFLAGRIALYMEDFDAVISYGNELMRKNSLLYDITASGITFGKTSFSFIAQRTNPELIFNFGDVQLPYNYIYSLSGKGTGPFFQVSQRSENNLLSLYTPEDQRLKAFFDATTQYLPIKFSRTPSFAKGEAWRVAEVYLNMAEAYLRKASPNPTEALQLLNELRRHRITNYVNLTEGDFQSNEALLKMVWEERRRELCFEECHRWWDLRRQGMPELKHVMYYKGGNTETYRLKKGDANYTLEIPRAERDYNPTIQLNNREEKTPEN